MIHGRVKAMRRAVRVRACVRAWYVQEAEWGLNTGGDEVRSHATVGGADCGHGHGIAGRCPSP